MAVCLLQEACWAVLFYKSNVAYTNPIFAVVYYNKCDFQASVINNIAVFSILYVCFWFFWKFWRYSSVFLLHSSSLSPQKSTYIKQIWYINSMKTECKKHIQPTKSPQKAFFFVCNLILKLFFSQKRQMHQCFTWNINSISGKKILANCAKNAVKNELNPKFIFFGVNTLFKTPLFCCFIFFCRYNRLPEHVIHLSQCKAL